MNSRNVLKKVVNVCGKIVEIQEHLRPLYERCVVRNARVIVG